MSYEEIRTGLLELYSKGIKHLYMEGGEPFLWRDGSRRLEDLVKLAREIGFLYIIIYTNGTFPITTRADLVFVSLDGLKDNHEAIRGKCYDRIISNIRSSDHGNIFVNFTITAINKESISEFCEAVNKIRQVKGICFYLYTPYNGRDELFLTPDDKKQAVDLIISLKKKGHRIINSKTALRSALSGRWKRPNGLNYLYAENKLYRCCRAAGNDDICDQCGYLGFIEIHHLSRLNPDAIWTAFKYY